MENKSIFYIQDLPNRNFFTEYFDLIIDKNYLYLISQVSNNTGLYVVFGFIVAFIIFYLGYSSGGLIIIAYIIGRAINRDRRRRFRSAWINKHNKLISEEYIKHSYLKIPLAEIHQHLFSEGKNNIVILNNDIKIILKLGTKKYKLLNDRIKDID